MWTSACHRLVTMWLEHVSELLTSQASWCCSSCVDDLLRSSTCHLSDVLLLTLAEKHHLTCWLILWNTQPFCLQILQSNSFYMPIGCIMFGAVCPSVCSSISPKTLLSRSSVYISRSFSAVCLELSMWLCPGSSNYDGISENLFVLNQLLGSLSVHVHIDKCVYSIQPAADDCSIPYCAEYTVPACWYTPWWDQGVQGDNIEVVRPYLIIFFPIPPILEEIFHQKELGRIYLSIRPGIENTHTPAVIQFYASTSISLRIVFWVQNEYCQIFW